MIYSPDTAVFDDSPGRLGIDIGELHAQPLGVIGRHDPPLHHPDQHIRHQQPLPTRLSSEPMRHSGPGIAIPANRERGG
ncbi:hypothetical protein [Streptomyces sp. NPDC052494]|uniref:hypothetical protein n=1 Tax=Streptomyces sp. NPDC052494 TaxID=3365692 RepID=UPI0037D25959